MSDDEKITRLPVRYKRPPEDEGRVLKVIDNRFDKDQCDHRSRWQNGHIVGVTYQIREGETEVECGACGTRLDPMWVLRMLAYKETEFENKRKIAREEMARLHERSRTKCQHCEKMTKISRGK